MNAASCSHTRSSTIDRRYLLKSVELKKVLAPGCGYNELHQFNKDDITSWKKEIADLTGIQYAGFDSNR